MKWLARTVRNERRALERARRRFIAKPNEQHLHEVRTTGRRFRSLLEDVADLVPAKRLVRRVKRAAAATDAARDATILRRLLESSVSAGEIALAGPLLDELRRREHTAMTGARQRLRRMHFEA